MAKSLSQNRKSKKASVNSRKFLGGDKMAENNNNMALALVAIVAIVGVLGFMSLTGAAAVERSATRAGGVFLPEVAAQPIGSCDVLIGEYPDITQVSEIPVFSCGEFNALLRASTLEASPIRGCRLTGPVLCIEI